MLLRVSCVRLFFVVFIHGVSYAQKSYIIQTVAFYNLENLFDTINNPNKLDELSPMMEIKSNRKYIYQDKLSKLANVLLAIGKEKNKLPPSLIGIAEVENKKVIQDLIATKPLNNFNYGIVHFESPDQRGIDTALLYNKDVYKPLFNEALAANLYKDNLKIDTRDILHTTGYLLNEKVHVLVNHWPSRRGGVAKSNMLREKIAWRVKKIIDKIYTEEPNAKIIIMGDFNDNPNNSSFKKILETKIDKHKLEKEDLYNPFEKMFKRGCNTLTFKGDLFLFDQIIFNGNLITKTKNYKDFKFYKAGIYNPSYMTLQSGKYKGSPRRSFGNGTYLEGYSDHYPVYSYLLKENN